MCHAVEVTGSEPKVSRFSGASSGDKYAATTKTANHNALFLEWPSSQVENTTGHKLWMSPLSTMHAEAKKNTVVV